MLSKRKLNHQYKYIKKIKARYLLLIAIVFLGIGFYSLRQNNLQMIELRQAVEVADKEGENVEEKLRELREYVHSHMNTDLSSGNAIKPPIQLKHRFERLAKAEADAVKQANAKVNAQAESVCSKRFPKAGFNSPRVECITTYTRENALVAREIPAELYKFDFVTPSWTSDTAGLSLLAGGLFFALAFIRAVTGWWYRIQLKHR